MTAKREAELETENRVLREQVASLERIVEQVSRPAVALESVPGAAACPWWGQQYTVPGYGNFTVTLPHQVTSGLAPDLAGPSASAGL